MTKYLLISLFVVSVLFASSQNSFYDFTVTDIEGKTFELSSLKGKKVLVVNTASKCGLTPQFEQLQSVYKKFGGDEFTIIGFPANNFANQEPKSDSEIVDFCQKNYGVTFPMMSKISVKGDDMHPLYQWLTKKSNNGVLDSDVAWNFQKYLIDENGKLVEMVSPKVKPDDEKVVSWINN